MNLMEKYEASAFQELAPLDNRDEHRTWLVMHRASKHLFVRKEVGRENYEIAKRIMDIRNEHLVRIDHVYEADGAFFVLEDYIAGQTLEELLEEKGALTEEESREFTAQILKGLDMLHRCGSSYPCWFLYWEWSFTSACLRDIQDNIAPMVHQDSRMRGTTGSPKFSLRKRYGESTIKRIAAGIKKMLRDGFLR